MGKDPGGKEVGRLSLKVLPDTSQFVQKLKAFAERMERQVRIEIPVSIEGKGAAAELKALQERLEAQAHLNPVEIPAELDSSPARRQLSSLLTQLNRVSSATARGTSLMGRYALILAAVASAVGALAASLPGLIAIIGSPIAAAIVGFDGIKKAAAGLTDQVKRLKVAVSDAFERGMTPGFARLSKVFPTLQKGLSGVAGGFSSIFDEFTKAVTSKSGLARIGSILEKVQNFLRDMAPAAKPFTDSILILADAASSVADSMTDDFIDNFKEFNRLLQKMAKDKDLRKGMEGIGHAINLILAGLGGLALLTIQIAAEFERFGESVKSAFDGTTKALSGWWDSIATPITDGLAALKTYWASTWNSLTTSVSGAFASMTTKVKGAWTKIKTSTTAAWNGFVTTLSAAWTKAKTTVSAGITKVVTFIQELPGKLLKIGTDMARGLLKGIQDGWGKVTSWVESAINKIPVVVRKLLGIASPSRVFAKIGKHTVQGLVVGLESQRKKLQQATLKTFDLERKINLASPFNPKVTAGLTAQMSARVGAIVDNTTSGPQEIILNWETGRGYMRRIAQTALAAKEFQARQDALLAGGA